MALQGELLRGHVDSFILLWEDGRDDETAAAQHPPDIFTSTRRSTSPHWDTWLYRHGSRFKATRMLCSLTQHEELHSFQLSWWLFLYLIMVYNVWRRDLNHWCRLSPPYGQMRKNYMYIKNTHKGVKWSKQCHYRVHSAVVECKWVYLTKYCF